MRLAALCGKTLSRQANTYIPPQKKQTSKKDSLVLKRDESGQFGMHPPSSVFGLVPGHSGRLGVYATKEGMAQLSRS